MQGDGTYASHAEANFTFEMKISQACQYNVVTMSNTDYVSDFAYTIPIAQGSAPLTQIPSTSTASSSVSLTDSGGTVNNNCRLDTTLEGYLDATQEWVRIDSSTISSTFDFLDLSTLDEANRVVNVQTTNRSKYNNPLVYNLRWKTIDRLSHQEGGTQYQEFTVTLDYACYQDVVVVDNDMDNDVSRITIDEASAVTLDSSYATNSGCDWTAALWIFDPSLEEFVPEASHDDGPLFAIDSATAIVTILVDTLNSLGGGVIVGSHASFVEYSVAMKVVYTSTWSTIETTDYFDVTFRSRCWGNTITTTSSNAEHYTYNIDSTGDYVDPVFTAAQTHATCARTCTFEVWDVETEMWRAYNY